MSIVYYTILVLNRILYWRAPGAARRGAWGARTVRATAAAVGPGAARQGAWVARTALGHRRRRRGAREPPPRGPGGGELLPTIELANKQRKKK